MRMPPPLVGVDQPLIDGFVIKLPFPMARRIDEGSLVFWHTPRQLTFWISVLERDPQNDLLEAWLQDRSAEAYDECVERDGALLRFSYRLVDDGTNAIEPAFHGLVTSEGTEFFLAAYFDLPELLPDVLATWRSIKPTPR